MKIFFLAGVLNSQSVDGSGVLEGVFEEDHRGFKGLLKDLTGFFRVSAVRDLGA